MSEGGIRLFIIVDGKAFQWVMLPCPYCEACDLYLHCFTHGLREYPRCPCDIMPPRTGVYKKVNRTQLLDMADMEGI